MPKIVFVCTKNRFRSPLAAAILQQELNRRGFGDSWVVESVGSWVQQLAPPTPEAIFEAEKRGFNIRDHRARGIEGISREQVDLFLVMETGQKESILIEYPNLKYKVFLLSEMMGLSFSIPDPYVTGEPHSEIAAEIEEIIDSNFSKIVSLAKKLSH
ncbi:MAG: hypothetical protein ACOYKC_04280 [Anaerolineaceae bacterium]|jgi:protein-tyrosine-phosphatase